MSTIQVQADKVAQCNAILQSLLPRESHSKEVDSALLSVIGYPAFAVDDQEIINTTKQTIINKCLGRYGCCRFLRDGYKTAIEDPHRLHYEPWELQKFENIECEWPVFLAFLAINDIFDDNKESASDYLQKLTKTLVQTPSGTRVVPEMYAVPADNVKKEWEKPGSQDRVPVGQVPHKWGQSLYIICRLLIEGFIAPGELDPLNRRLTVLPKPDLVVQLVVLAEDDGIKECLEGADLKCHTVDSLQADGRYVLHAANTLGETLSHLGKCPRLGLTGRYAGVGLLATSTLYRFDDKTYCFTPELYDYRTFYLAMDQDFVFDQIRTDLTYLKANWQMLGRPTMILPIYNWMADFSGDVPYEFKRAITKMQSGYFGGVRVQLGDIDSFLSTSSVSSIDWLLGANTDVQKMIGRTSPSLFRSRLSSGGKDLSKRSGLRETVPAVHGIIKRALSIPVDDPTSHVPTFRLGDDLVDTPPRSRSPSKNRSRPLLSISGHLKVSASAHFPTNMPGSTADLSKTRTPKDMVEMLTSTDDACEQADIIHYLYITVGPDYQFKLDEEDDQTVTVRELLQELYHKAGALKIWWLIRYTAGMLRKRVSSLASALSDLLVRQKEVTFGLPTKKETVISQPLSPEDIALRIELVCVSEHCSPHEKYKPVSPHCMLHQELLIYLAMFVRTEPKLFHEMLRVRIGLIIAVMTTELSRCLDCSGEEATSHLLNLSPFELKNLLHHIISGKEFVIHEVEESHLAILTDQGTLSTRNKKSIKHRISSPGISQLEICSEMLEGEDDETCEDSDSGQWSRRRRIDGALNRAPIGFYSKIWHVLEQCQGIVIEGKVLSQNLIKEMTEGELKFALQVESVLNHVPEPEYRQLIVEALITLTVFSEMNRKGHFVNMVIPVNDIVTKAYHIFLQDQGITEGRLTKVTGKSHNCHRLRGICEAFYDRAPSGSFGTMTYMCRALPQVIDMPTTSNSDSIECVVQ